MAGTVEAVGTNVTGFRPGDEVFGGLEDFTRARGEYDLLIDIAA
jgi:NADPH:quinone reductase-like Zn-dependent oxidoreductase